MCCLLISGFYHFSFPSDSWYLDQVLLNVAFNRILAFQLYFSLSCLGANIYKYTHICENYWFLPNYPLPKFLPHGMDKLCLRTIFISIFAFRFKDYNKALQFISLFVWLNLLSRSECAYFSIQDICHNWTDSFFPPA